METTLLASGGADPPDASTWERSAVIYVALMLLVLISLHVRWECRKQMKWEQISWEHVAEGRDRSRVRALSVFRLCCCLVVLANDGILIFFTREMPLLGGWKIFGTFTVWSWTLIGIYMGLAGVASLSHACKIKPNKVVVAVLCRFLWLLFEVMLPVSFLIFVVVWLVLLPAAYQTSGTDLGLLSLPALAAHNLNVVFMLIEARLNRLCMTSFHLIFIFYYGALYVIFSWILFGINHNFFYFFIDWRYPVVLIGYTGILSMLAGFFFICRWMVNRAKPEGLQSDSNLHSPRSVPLAAPFQRA
ncbi:Uncharacterized protein SCF082_LOCUS4065 [Durusdinium trenchii]|uniref:Uncharacterized protein n=1 Tax=Durusdinium trenchii TaxID=1381693 RepID=A0ABP0HX17_9DINO